MGLIPKRLNQSTWLLAGLLIIVALLGSSCNSAGSTPAPAASQAAATTPAETATPAAVATPAGAAAPAVTATEAVLAAPTVTAVPLKRETRAIWSWAGADASSKEDIDRLVAQVDAAHLNVILFGVYEQGRAFFELSTRRFPNEAERLPNSSKLHTERYSDALHYLLTIRDRRQADNDPTNDFEVQAWFAIIDGGAEKKDGRNDTSPDALNALFPEFVLKTGLYYSDPKGDHGTKYNISTIQQPRFRAYMTDLVAGLVEDYDVDGVHLDFIRTGGICFNDDVLDYPGTEYDYPGCQADYRAWTRQTYGREYTLWEDTDGYETIQDEDSGRVSTWLERPVNDLVKRISDEVRQIRPGLVITIASKGKPVTPEERRSWTQGQVAWEWLDRGWADAVFLMNYDEETGNVVEKLQAYINAAQKDSSRDRIFTGLGVYDVPGRNRSIERGDALLLQIDAVMRAGQVTPPVRGVALFRAEAFSQESARALGDGPFREPAAPYWGR